LLKVQIPSHELEKTNEKKDKGGNATVNKEPELPDEFISHTQSKFLRLIEFEVEAAERFDHIKWHIGKLRELIEIDKRRGYQGERRGWEVCLPNPIVWGELNLMLQSEDAPLPYWLEHLN